SIAISFDLLPDLLDQVLNLRGYAVAPMLWRYRNQRQALGVIARQSIEQVAQHGALVRSILQRNIRVRDSQRNLRVTRRIRVESLKLAAGLDCELVLGERREHVDDPQIHVWQMF